MSRRLRAYMRCGSLLKSPLQAPLSSRMLANARPQASVLGFPDGNYPARTSSTLPMPSSPSSIPRRVWGGTGLLIAGRLYGSVCTFTALYVLAHHLEAEAFGRYTFYLAIFVLLDSLTDFGTGTIAVQRTAHDEGAVPEVLAATRRIRFG